MAVYLQPNVISTGIVPPAAAQESTASASTSFQQQMNAALGAPKSLESIFKQAAKTYNVPENLLKAVAKVESNFQADAVSSCGATGIMQLMPSTAKGLGVKDAKDPEQNIMGGAKYLSQMLERYDGDQKLALAAYNAGSGNVAKYGGVPPFAETQAYVKKVLQAAGQGVTVPNQTVSSGASSVSTETPVGSSLSTSALGQSMSLSDITQALFTDTDVEYTYEDYQLFLEVYLNQVRMSVNNQNNSDSDTPAFWL